MYSAADVLVPIMVFTADLQMLDELLITAFRNVHIASYKGQSVRYISMGFVVQDEPSRQRSASHQQAWTGGLPSVLAMQQVILDTTRTYRSMQCMVLLCRIASNPQRSIRLLQFSR